MYEIRDNILTISVNDWIRCGLTDAQYRHDKQRSGLHTTDLAKGGETRIVVSSIPSRRLRQIELHLGKAADNSTLSVTEIERKQEAIAFYAEFRYMDETGKQRALPEDKQTQYVNEASLLDYFAKRRRMMRENGRRISKKEYYARCVEKAKGLAEGDWTNNLPRNVRSFERRFEEYLNGGYRVLIHNNYGKKQAEKITAEAKLWLIARFATPVEKLTMKQLFYAYNAEVVRHPGSDVEDAWKPLKSEDTIRMFLERPEIKPLWYGMRYGELEAKEKYTRQHRTILPTRRDTLWYGDGTKLNYYYLDENGKRATMNVYEVVDVYSECFLGYQESKTENFADQYYAYRKALQFAGHKPYEIKFDNQGGHKKLMGGNFFKSLARVAITTMPYNGRSKTIESIFGRFQSEYLHKEWFFTGQNVTAKKMESRPNMEMVLANTENLPSKEEALKTYLMRREEWNNAILPGTNMTRIEAYRKSKNEQAQPVSMLDLIDIFGIINPTPITYRSNGVQMKVCGIQYEWEVLTADGAPDFDFLSKNVDRKFHVKYDPKDMSIVSLYTKDANGYRFEALAQKYIKVHRALQDQDKLDHSFIRVMDERNKQMRIGMQAETERIMEEAGVHPSQHGLNMPKLKGISAKKAAKHEDYGEFTKEVSNIDMSDIRSKY